MKLDYQRCIDFWDNVFSKEDSMSPTQVKIGNDVLDNAIAWLCLDSVRVLDFGCGNGGMLFLCAQNGAKEHVGIDLSKEAIASAQRISTQMPKGKFEFFQGGVERLSSLLDQSFDGIILSNIIDNLYPEDAKQLLRESARILKRHGKLLVKLNPYLMQEQITAWDIKQISGNMLDDGLLLWNNTTEQWRALFAARFTIKSEGEVYYPEHEQTNRLFCLMKP